jgi:hypothetical protein
MSRREKRTATRERERREREAGEARLRRDKKIEELRRLGASVPVATCESGTDEALDALLAAERERQDREQQRRENRQEWRWVLKPIPQVFEWYKNNAVAGTLLVAAFLVVKGYVIARGNLATALGILQAAGLTSIVVAGLLSSLPILAASLLAATIYRTVRALMPKPEAAIGSGGGPHRPVAGRREKMVWALAGAFVLCMFFTPVPYMVFAIFLGVIAGSARGALVDPHKKSWQVLIFRLLFGLAAVYAVIAMLYTVWLPHETVTLPAGSAKAGNGSTTQVVGYVIADNPDGWITILTSGGRQLVTYRDMPVQSLAVCDRTPQGGLSDVFYASTLWNTVARSLNLHIRPATYQPCP